MLSRQSDRAGGRGSASDAGYVTVEAAMVFCALTVVAGAIVAGVISVVAYVGTVDLARDAARAAALNPADMVAAVDAVVEARGDDAEDVTVSVDAGTTAAAAETVGTVTVRVTRNLRFIDVTATAVIVAEPVAGSDQSAVGAAA